MSPAGQRLKHLERLLAPAKGKEPIILLLTPGPDPIPKDKLERFEAEWKRQNQNIEYKLAIVGMNPEGEIVELDREQTRAALKRRIGERWPHLFAQKITKLYGGGIHARGQN